MEGITLRQLECFLEVCRDLHFSRAAKRLGMAQPPLSRQVKELEGRVGARLFAREGKSVCLTPAGAAFLKEAWAVPGALQRALVAARRAASGEGAVLRIGFVGAILGEALMELFQRFRAGNPGTQLSLADLAPAELLRQVELGELDGAFLGVKPRKLPGALRQFSWKKEPLRLCVAAEHRLAGRKSARLEELGEEALVALSWEVAPAYREFLDTLFADRGARAPATLETNGAQAMLALVVAGCGVALLPESAFAAAGARVQGIRLAGKAAPIEEVFVCGAEKAEPLELFVDALRAE